MTLPRRPALGFRGLPAPAGGVVVTDPRSPAAAAALRPGDRLLMVDERPVDHPRAIAVLLRGRSVGDAVTLRLRRDDRPHVVTMILAPLPEETCPDAHVHYDSLTVDGSRLRTITVRPRRPGPLPAALLLPGVACVSQDLAVTDDPRARAIVAALAAAGVVSLRIDRPGLGDSEGGPCEALAWSQEIALFRAGLAALASDPAIDPEGLGLFGAGVGGMLAPVVGADERARRIAVEATSARRWSACLRRVAERSSAPTPEPHLRSEQFAAELEAVDLPLAWRSLTADVLVVQGEPDPLVDPDDPRALADLLARRAAGITRYVPGGSDPAALAEFLAGRA